MPPPPSALVARDVLSGPLGRLRFPLATGSPPLAPLGDWVAQVLLALLHGLSHLISHGTFFSVGHRTGHSMGCPVVVVASEDVTGAVLDRVWWSPDIPLAAWDLC